MRVPGFLLLACFAGSSATAGSKDDGPPVPVFVQNGSSRVPDEAAGKAMKKELGGRWAAASEAWTALDRELMAKHGKRRDKWPPEAKQKYLESRAAVARLQFDVLYLPTLQKELDDSTADLRQRLSDDKLAPLAPSRDAASWVITPVGRYSYGFNPTGWCTALEVAPGAGADRSVALSVLAKHHESSTPNKVSETLDSTEGAPPGAWGGSFNAPTEADPRLLVGTCGVGMRWKAAAGAMKDFAKDLARRYNQAGRPAR